MTLCFSGHWTSGRGQIPREETHELDTQSPWALSESQAGTGRRNLGEREPTRVRRCGSPAPGWVQAAPQDGETPKEREPHREHGLPESQLSPEQLYLGGNDVRPGKHHPRAREVTGPSSPRPCPGLLAPARAVEPAEPGWHWLGATQKGPGGKGD